MGARAGMQPSVNDARSPKPRSRRPSAVSEVEVYHHWRMVAACRYALLVEVLDVPHDPMAADPDRIEAPWVARRVLPPPRPVGDGRGPHGLLTQSLSISSG